MASLNDIVQRVKARLQPQGIAEDDLAFTIGQQIYPALEELARVTARDRKLRYHFLTDPNSTTVSLDGNGVADLSSLVGSQNVLLDCIQYGDVFPPAGYPSTQPFRMILNNSQGQISGALDSLVYKAWLEGPRLHTKSADNNVVPLAGTISLEVPYVPTLAQVPYDVSGMLVDVLVARMGVKNAAK